MKPVFWKLSHGFTHFTYPEFLESIEDKLAYIHKDTKAKGQSPTTQGHDFISAEIGNYFYLTYGNRGIYLLGQFVGPANIFSNYGDGWLDRSYRIIARSKSNKDDIYAGPDKWWSPNHNSTFVKVPDNELMLFEEHILVQYFGIQLKEYGFK